MKYKVGDKVRITTDKSKSKYWDEDGKMDKWLGKTMTVKVGGLFIMKGSSVPCYRMLEDQTREDCGCIWHEDMIDGFAYKHEINITSDGKVTIATMKVNGKKIKTGTAKCSPKDRFNFKAGVELALQRMWDDGKQNGETQNKESQHEPVKQVDEKETGRKGKWIPKEDEMFWIINIYGKPNWTFRECDSSDIYFEHIPCFKTKEECQEYIDIHKDFKEKSFEPDWDDTKQKKWFIGYKNDDVYFSWTSVKTDAKYVFRSPEICGSLFTRWGSEKIAKYILEVY